jgi:hypothetical protein
MLGKGREAVSTAKRTRRQFLAIAIATAGAVTDRRVAGQSGT